MLVSGGDVCAEEVPGICAVDTRLVITWFVCACPLPHLTPPAPLFVSVCSTRPCITKATSGGRACSLQQAW